MTAEAARGGRLLVAAAAVCWSAGGLIARLVDTDPWTTVLWRGVFCAAFLVGVTGWRERRRTLDAFLAMGATGLGMAVCFATASTCFIVALSRTSVANVLIIQSLSPFMAGLLGWAWMGERVAGRTWAAMGVALLGSTIMVSRYFYAEAAGALGGDLLAFTVALAFAIATVLLRRNRHVPMLPAAALAAALTSVVAAIPGRPRAVDAADLLLLAFFGAGQLGFGMILFIAGARRIPVAEAALIAVLESVLGPVWVWLALGENPGLPSLLGGAIVLAALAGHTVADLRLERRAIAAQSASGSGSRKRSSTGT
jgi:drug/metabolite transporter (DMT)-like permease